MAEKREEKKAKGGFRATLALIISIIALIVAGVAYQRSTTQTDVSDQISNLQQRMKKIKEENAERLKEAREDMRRKLQELGVKIGQ